VARIGSKLLWLVVYGFCLGLGLNSGAQASTTTVSWTGTSNFNDAWITFAPFTANELTDIYGAGEYEACCRRGPTAFTLSLRLGPTNTWTSIFSWSSTGDETQHLLGNLVPPGISFTTALVSGIMLSSNPNGSPSSDYNYTSFNFPSYLSHREYYEHYRSRYRDWDDYLNCHDYEDYLRSVTKFVFNYTPPASDPPATPLPAPFFLMGTVLAGTYLVGRWRRRRVRAVA
jgi:hypothetical protein